MPVAPTGGRGRIKTGDPAGKLGQPKSRNESILDKHNLWSTYLFFFFFPECVARVPVSLGGLGVRLCSPSFAFAFATVGNRPQPFATVGNRLCVRRKALHSGERV